MVATSRAVWSVSPIATSSPARPDGFLFFFSFCARCRWLRGDSCVNVRWRLARPVNRSRMRSPGMILLLSLSFCTDRRSFPPPPAPPFRLIINQRLIISRRRRTAAAVIFAVCQSIYRSERGAISICGIDFIRIGQTKYTTFFCQKQSVFSITSIFFIHSFT